MTLALLPYAASLPASQPLADAGVTVAPSAEFVSTASLAAVIALVTPYLVALVNQPKWSPHVKNIVAVVVSVLLGLGAAVVNGTLGQAHDVVAAVVIVVVGAQIAYKQVLGQSASALEHVTSGRPIPQTFRGELKSLPVTSGTVNVMVTAPAGEDHAQVASAVQQGLSRNTSSSGGTTTLASPAGTGTTAASSNSAGDGAWSEDGIDGAHAAYEGGDGDSVDRTADDR